jgi:tellurite resistance protein TerC
MTESIWLWVGFNVFVLAMLALDLGVFHRKAHVVSLKESLVWTFVWIGLALVFNAGVWHYAGSQKALEFFTGYLIEKSLSVDNVFVFALLFSYFAVPPLFQHTVLFWGILGALLFRALFIAAGVGLINALHWTLYVLGAFLVVSGLRLAFEKERAFNPEKNLSIRLFRKFFPVSDSYDANRFFTRRNGALLATPLFITLLVVETTDIVFATDSIPAILGITTDPFLVYSSNIFAILGLRALYFVLAGVMRLFRFLHYGLSLILVFVGLKMLAERYVQLSVELELGTVLAILLLSILASVIIPDNDARAS